MNDLKFDLDDIVIVPAEGSDINSRSCCNVTTEFNGWNRLPLMASPMDTVVSSDNYMWYIVNNIIPCLPRGTELSMIHRSLKQYMFFQAFSLCDIETQLHSDDTDVHHFYKYPNVLIDIANGNMNKLIPLIKEIKEKFPNIVLMVGNVANPETFANLGLAGADYVRCSIGTGCFLPRQSVKTQDGNKNIEEVNISDQVITHTGEYKKIVNKFEHDLNGEIFEINDIKCTEYHEFYVVEKKYENIITDENISEYAKWISAKDLDKNNYFLIQYSNTKS
jgi:hypothetical protein